MFFEEPSFYILKLSKMEEEMPSATTLEFKQKSIEARQREKPNKLLHKLGVDYTTKPGQLTSTDRHW